MATDVLSVRPVSRQVWPHRVRLVGSAGPRLWNGRLVLRCGIAGIPIGAMAGLVLGFVGLRQTPMDALWSYAYGAGIGLVVGMLLGGLLGVLGAVVSRMRWSRPAPDQRRLWVRHRTEGAVTLRQ
jgi:hypothetical protein